MNLPRVMLAAPSSGSGKTLVTCGLLQALVNRKKKVAAFKCGPDYIDPMFHKKVIGTPSRNLDTFFADAGAVRYLFGKASADAQMSVIEGVMGFYDGIAGITPEASSWDLARTLDAPVILVVNARGMSLSVTALIRGFLEGPEGAHNSQIRGVILNQTSASIYPEMKQMIEEALPVRVLGYLPRVDDCLIESRHLGLMMPDEIAGLKENLNRLAAVMEETVDIDGIISLAKSAAEIEVDMPSGLYTFFEQEKRTAASGAVPRIGVAMDEAFCFYYEDNLELLHDLGTEIVPFSPLKDSHLPTGLQGLLFGGGYPELYAEQLSGNTAMQESIREALRNHMPCLAECGGFMYLHETMEDMQQTPWPMVGAIAGKAVRTTRLNRFGYITITAKKDQIYSDCGAQIRAHEFHYFDSTMNGDAFQAQKPRRKRNWECVIADDNFAAGFPHLYYYSNPEFAASFVRRCRNYNLD